VHLLEEGQNHPIVRFAYLCHMIGEEYIFLSFFYIKIFELVQKWLLTTDPRLPTTNLICSNFHFEAAALSSPVMLEWCSFASASFTSRNPSSLLVDRLNSKIYTTCRASLIYILGLLGQIFFAADF